MEEAKDRGAKSSMKRKGKNYKFYKSFIEKYEIGMEVDLETLPNPYRSPLAKKRKEPLAYPLTKQVNCSHDDNCSLHNPSMVCILSVSIYFKAVNYDSYS